MTHNPQYIWQKSSWPKFQWDSNALLKTLGDCRFQQGSLLAQMRELGLEVQQQARAEVLIKEDAGVSFYQISADDFEGNNVGKDGVPVIPVAAIAFMIRYGIIAIDDLPVATIVMVETEV